MECVRITPPEWSRKKIGKRIQGRFPEREQVGSHSDKNGAVWISFMLHVEINYIEHILTKC